MNEQFAVRLMQPIAPALRPEKAKQVAPRFGVSADKVEKLLSRNPGLITKPTSQAEAQRVATVFSSVGIQVEVIDLNTAPQPRPASSPPANEPKELIAQAQVPLAASTPAYSEAPQPTDVNEGVVESVIWTSSSALPASAPESSSPRLARAVRAPAAPDARTPDDTEPTRMTAGTNNHQGRRRRFSLRWKLLLAALAPIVLLTAATLYFAYESVSSSTVRLLTEVGDNIALTLASDLSAYITENELQLSDSGARTEIALYFASRIKTLTPGLHETVGVHFTDPNGQRVAGFWKPEIQQNPRFFRLEERFKETAQAATEHADFGQSAEELAASLPARTKVFESFYVIGTPLVNDIGTVQVVLAEGNIIRTSLGVIQPIIIAAASALLLGLLLTILLAVGLSRNIRRLASVADRISLGELDEPVEVKGNDEIRDVAESLERMRVSLQSAINRLRKRGRK